MVREKADLWASLPLDLLPVILGHLQRRKDLWSLCLVSKEFNQVATGMLYSSIRLYGRDLHIAPILLRELATNPKLCRLIQRFEVRVYPISMIVKEKLAIEAQAVDILREAVNIRHLFWTRKGALTDRVLEQIVKLPHLESFEFNGATQLSPGSWSTEYLLQLPRLRSLSIILPDRNVATSLSAILAHQAQLAQKDGIGLENFTILSRESVVVNDNVVTLCGPYLTSLSSLGLAGCAKLTGKPLLQILPTLHHLKHLSLEATSIPPSFYTAVAPHLSQLHTKRLRAFTCYHSGATDINGVREWPVIEPTTVQAFADAVGGQLHKLELSGILIANSAVDGLTSSFPELRDLVLHLGYYQFDASQLGEAFSKLSHLQTLHVQCQRTDVSFDDVAYIARKCSTTLQQMGLRNQVWLIRRDVSDPNGDGDERNVLRFSESAEAFGAFRRSRYVFLNRGKVYQIE
ncbi:hypothetical protein MNV49_003294 [Pseudohyphozyma bogoriensis]|nr:hypothetical protein MNV49_003294 [Pseudohyphozyma bogoriensis]